MKPLVMIILLSCSLYSNSIFAQEQQVVVPYTLADRDRAIRTEVKMDTKFEAVNARN